MNPIDSLLNRFTMYKVVMYGLFILTFISLILSVVGWISFPVTDLLATLILLIFSCYFINLLLAKVLNVYPNSESSVITALILYFLLWPSIKINDIIMLLTAALIAMASKYIISYRHKHIFNPAALATFSLIFLKSGAVWWIATPVMLPFVTVIGLLFVRKVRKFTMFFTFLIVSTLTISLFSIFKNHNLSDSLLLFINSFPVIFFGTVMLIEPLTTPPSKKLQIIYASIVGFLFSYQGSLGLINTSPELALLVGNLYSFAVSPKFRVKLKLLEKIEIAKDTLELVFEKPKAFSYLPGQYLEWTAPAKKADLRGNRRYFTISSSPTEDRIRLGVKLNSPPSSFKKILENLKKGEELIAGSLSGDFVLKHDAEKLVFIAGGIGITPFRSLIKNMLDTQDNREVTLFYSNKTADEIAYKDLLGDASQKLGIKVVYLLTDEEKIPPNFNGEKGRLTKEILSKYLKTVDRTDFYLSGPIAMVEGYKKLLKSLGVKRNKIHTDYFPGF